MDAAEREEIHREIRETDLEIAQADKRLARYRTIADQIRHKSQTTLKSLSFSAADMVVPPDEGTLTPEETENLQRMLSQIGIVLPEFLQHGLSPRSPNSPVADAPAPSDTPRKKRVKFHL